ncbi:MAG: peptidylprolyl isomerase [Pseudomonadota bacterium]
MARKTQTKITDSTTQHNDNDNKGVWIVLVIVCLLGLAVLGYTTNVFKKGEQTGDTTVINDTDNGTTDTAMDADGMAVDADAKASLPVAIVNGQTVTHADMDEFLAMLPPQMKSAPLTEIYPMVQEQLVANSILLQKAETAIAADDAEVTKRMEEARKQIIRGVYLEREVDKQINPADVQKDYDAFIAKQPVPEEISARHILVPTEAEAKDLITKLQAGEDFKKLSAAFSQDPGTKATGELGYFSRDMMVKEFADAAFSMEKGQISAKPVKTQFGYHVIQVLDKRTRELPTLEQMKPTLEGEMRRTVFSKILGDLRNGADVQLFDMNGAKIDATTPEAATIAPAPAPTTSDVPADDEVIEPLPGSEAAAGIEGRAPAAPASPTPAE